MDITINGGGETGKRIFNALVKAVVAQVHEVQAIANGSSWPGVVVLEIPDMPSVSIREINNSLTIMDITINGPKGSGKTKLAAQIWAWLEGKRSLVQVHAFPKDAVKQCKTWHAVGADVIVWDGCLSALIDRVQAQNIMQFYRETYNRDAVAIYITQQP